MFLILPFIFSLNAKAENFRAPAVLDGSCNLNIPTTVKIIVNGKESVVERPLKEVLKEQCVEVKKCMNSASDEEMEELVNLEAVACKNSLNAVTTKVPGLTVDKNFDGKRKAKSNAETEEVSSPSKIPAATNR